MRVVAALCVSIVLVGCASSARDVQPSYVSPLTYQDLDCAQLGLEAERLSERAIVLTGSQDKKRTRDAVATTAAVVIFWPAAFLVGGDDATTAELASVKGRLEAVQTEAISKRCDIVIHAPETREPAQRAPRQDHPS